MGFSNLGPIDYLDIITLVLVLTFGVRNHNFEGSFVTKQSPQEIVFRRPWVQVAVGLSFGLLIFTGWLIFTCAPVQNPLSPGMKLGVSCVFLPLLVLTLSAFPPQSLVLMLESGKYISKSGWIQAKQTGSIQDISNVKVISRRRSIACRLEFLSGSTFNIAKYFDMQTARDFADSLAASLQIPVVRFQANRQGKLEPACPQDCEDSSKTCP